MAKAGPSALIAAGLTKTVVFFFVSPLLGFLLGSTMMVVAWAFRRSSPLRADGGSGGWRIVRTMGQKITKGQPVAALC